MFLTRERVFIDIPWSAARKAKNIPIGSHLRFDDKQTRRISIIFSKVESSSWGAEKLVVTGTDRLWLDRINNIRTWVVGVEQVTANAEKTPLLFRIVQLLRVAAAVQQENEDMV